MRYMLWASVIFYALLGALALDYLISAARCECWPPAPHDLGYRIGVFYLLAVVAGFVLAWRDDG